jgi:hypothetical protein
MVIVDGKVCEFFIVFIQSWDGYCWLLFLSNLKYKYHFIHQF